LFLKAERMTDLGEGAAWRKKVKRGDELLKTKKKRSKEEIFPLQKKVPGS